MISGTLVDADCRSHDANDKCDVAEDTRTFGFKTEEGKYYKLDSEGNTKVQAALKNSMHKTGEIRASLSGTVDGDVFKVESVKIP